MFYLSQQLKSGVGLAARHNGEKHIATMQIATTGILQAAYAHKVTEKVREQGAYAVTGCT